MQSARVDGWLAAVELHTPMLPRTCQRACTPSLAILAQHYREASAHPLDSHSILLHRKQARNPRPSESLRKLGSYPLQPLQVLLSATALPIRTRCTCPQPFSLLKHTQRAAVKAKRLVSDC